MEIGIYDFAGAMVFERAYHNNIFDDLMYKITHNSRWQKVKKGVIK